MHNSPLPKTEQQRTRAAAELADAQIGFYVHFAIYILVNALLIFLNYRSGDAWWAQWPALGWGIGIIGHALGVFGRAPRVLADWRARRIHALRDNVH